MVNSVLVQTYFNPDEHWQALEVAHHITFGFGHLPWDWDKGIRSFLHPLLFALLYKLLTSLGLDTPWFMVKAPRLFQSLFSAFGDLYLYKLSVIFFGDQVAKWAGSGAWDYIFYRSFDGFSVMVFSFLPFSIDGIMQAKQWKLSGLIAWVLGVYSVLGHKEFRFVLPVLPIALIFSGYSLAALKTSVSGNGQRNLQITIPNALQKCSWPFFSCLLPIFQWPLYMSLVHQRLIQVQKFSTVKRKESQTNQTNS